MSQRPIWAALAGRGLINLFNLMPIWQLDGGRAFRSLTRPHRWLAVAAVATAWVLTEDDGSLLLLVIMIVGAARTVVEKPAREADPGSSSQYVALVAVPFGPGPDARSQIVGVRLTGRTA